MSRLTFFLVALFGCNTTDATCPVTPPTLDGGTSCSVEGKACSGAIACTPCGPGVWDMEPTYDCTCTNAHWQCAEPGPCVTGPGTYSDKNCTIPWSADAGSDAP